MPFLIHRRQFLSALTGSALATQAVVAANAPTTWALMSDPHINADLNAVGYTGTNIYSTVGRSVNQIAASAARLCVVPGDLSHVIGQPGDYWAFNQLTSSISSRMPMLAAVGNHDDRWNLQAAFRSAGVNQNVSGNYILILDYTDCRIIVLDSLWNTNQPDGILGSLQRTWLQSTLAATRLKTFVFVHHDPGQTDISLADATKFLNIVTAARVVKAVFFGHQHTYRVTSMSGMHLVQLPSAAYVFDPAEPVGWVQMVLTATGARLTLFANDANISKNGMVTNLTWR